LLAVHHLHSNHRALCLLLVVAVEATKQARLEMVWLAVLVAGVALLAHREL
jgi:hypothetical protein